MKHFIVSITALAAMCVFVSGQNVLSGTVVNAKTQKPLAAASVQELEGKSGTYTGKDGYFSLKVPQLPAEIRVSHIGYAEQTLVSDSTELLVALRPIVLHADEVFVTAQRAIDGKTPVAYSELEREDIDVLYHQQDVPLVLDMEPGVYALTQTRGTEAVIPT
ncbi:MAG: carboxypeptidase-like regulatory domain-containing protein [Candidatus Marinimicrobia bacterium]|nr:carboxypeptidase-like regulatory domain-containing protein [Candidatus Neomarinimicrobiota bacterium]